MLKLTRRLGEEIIVDGNITLRVIQIERPYVKIACIGPGFDGIGVWRRIAARKAVEHKVIVFGDDIEVLVTMVNANFIRLGISSRSDKSILRRELLESNR